MNLGLLYVMVFVAGGLGACLRYAADTLLKTLWSESMPLSIFVINVSGSFSLGLLTGLLTHLSGTMRLLEYAALEGNLALIVGTGLIGGYTTFSTALLEAVRTPDAGPTLILTAGQLVTATLAALAGLALGLWV